MKRFMKFGSLALCLVLTACLLAACGKSRQTADNSFVTNIEVNAGIGQIAVSWTKPTRNGLTGYEVWIDNDERKALGDVTSTLFTCLENGNEYTISIRAKFGNSWGTTVTETATPNDAVHGAVTDLAVDAGDSALTVRWHEPNANNLISAITHFDFVVEAEEPVVLVLNESVTVASVRAVDGFEKTITGLENGVEYNISISARNGAGLGEAATILATPDSTPLVTGLKVEDVGNGTVTLSWNAGNRNNGTAIVNYSIYVYTKEGNNFVPHSTPVFNITASDALADGYTYTVWGLANGMTYYFAITASNANMESELPAAPTIHATPAATAPTDVVLVENLLAYDTQTNSLTMVLSLNDGGSAITGITGSFSADGNIFGASFTTTDYTITRPLSFFVAENNAVLWVRIVVQNAVGETVPQLFELLFTETQTGVFAVSITD